MTTEHKAREVKRFAYDYGAGSISRDGKTYTLADLPTDARLAAGLAGLAVFLGRADDPDAFYAAVKSGAKKLVREAKVEALDPWREAAATVHAETSLKATGFRAAPGKKLRDTAEFLAALETARKIAKGWTKDQLAQAKSSPDVVKEHAALTGVSADLAGLFAPLNPVVDEALDEAA